MRNSYIALDLETTGLRPDTDRILEIGAVKVEEGEVTGTFSTFIDCGIPIPPFISELTGITQEMVLGSPSLKEGLTAFLDFSGEEVLLGHNLSFDYGFMKQNAVSLGFSYERKGLDTLRISRCCLPGLPKKSLDQVSAYYGIPQEHHHRALDDALTAARIYERLKEEYSEVYPELFEPSALNFKVKKASPITNSQKVYLRDLLKYHRINDNVKIEELTKSEASRMIDGIILKYGRMKR